MCPVFAVITFLLFGATAPSVVPASTGSDSDTPQLEASAPDEPMHEAQSWAVHIQATVTTQSAFGFPSEYTGLNSLPHGGETRETVDSTLYAGLRPWRGAEVWINPEIDQGFGLANTVGFAGFPSAEAYKVGASNPYIRLQRLYVRQTIDLGGERQRVDPDENALGGSQAANRLVLWAGKFQVTDVFDTNSYAHDPRRDFLNWTAIDAGTFDYAADSWGYTYGLAGEWRQGPWALRLGLFDMSRIPNGESPDDRFTEFEGVAEGERDWSWGPRVGKLKVTAYNNRARMGDFAAAVREGLAAGTTPNVLAVERYRGHAGVDLNVEQQMTSDFGVFLRAGGADGHQQSYEFTDVDRTASLGAALQGDRWGRPDDTMGLAGIVNDVSTDFKAYLAAGGLGLLIGDGQLRQTGPEEIAESYYSYAVNGVLTLTLDYQFIQNPAYNADRGPASVLAVRLHAAM